MSILSVCTWLFLHAERWVLVHWLNAARIWSEAAQTSILNFEIWEYEWASEPHLANALLNFPKFIKAWVTRFVGQWVSLLMPVFLTLTDTASLFTKIECIDLKMNKSLSNTFCTEILYSVKIFLFYWTQDPRMEKNIHLQESVKIFQGLAISVTSGCEKKSFKKFHFC